MKTVKDILETCQVGDVLTNGTLTWIVDSLDYDGEGTIVALPQEKSGFELWSSGIESVAIIPGLKKISFLSIT